MNPEDAELVGEEAVRALLKVARETYDLVVVDTAPFFYGPMLATLDQTDELLLLCNPDVPTLKNVRLTLKTLELLSFPEDRLRIVLNRASANLMDRGDVEAALDRKVDWVLPLDPSVPLAVNGASPAVLARPDAPFGIAMLELARATAGGDWATKQPQHSCSTGRRGSSVSGGVEHVSAAAHQRCRRLRGAGSASASHRRRQRSSDRPLRRAARVAARRVRHEAGTRAPDPRLLSG